MHFKHKTRKVLTLAISLLPIRPLRVGLYRLIFGYQIPMDTQLGWFVWICVDSFKCGHGVAIGRNTSFQGPIGVQIGSRTSIGRWNEFECPYIAAKPEKTVMKYKRQLMIGSDCVIHEDHFFDLYGLVEIGDGSWIAGRGSQFWTHGASAQERDIEIGQRCYLASACKFAPGASIGDGVFVGLGAVVTGKVDGTNQVIGGVPAKHLRSRSPSEDNLRFEKWDK
jgi:acetyltransferase-like isoleucine patch superfamily enzyme